MSQRVKINAGYSEKSSENFQSQQFTIGLEMEVQINGTTREVEDASSKLFALCRKIVSSQKGVNVDGLLQGDFTPPTLPSAPQPEAQPIAPPPPTNGNGNNGNGATKRASVKQIKFLLELAKRAGLSDQDINEIPMKHNRASFDALTSHEASRLIDTYSVKKAA